MERWDVAIIGSGPAALTAAIYTARGAASTVILGGEKWGGQLMLTTTVDNFPGFPQGIEGPDLIMAMRKQAERFGAEFREVNVEKVDFGKSPFQLTVNQPAEAMSQASLVSSPQLTARAVIVATGASTLWLPAPGINELIGRGVSSCAPCDAPFFRGKKVAVVGGGDSAMEEALTLAKYAAEVTIVHRRDAFRASKAMQQKVFAESKIKVLWDTEVVGAKGQSKLESISLRNNKTDESSELTVDGLFIAIGHKPETDIFRGPIEVDERGYIVVKDHTKTNIEGVFVAGDVHDYHYRQAITAAGYGCQAALDALRWLEEQK